MMEELSISERVSKFLKKNRGAYTTTRIKQGVNRAQTPTVYLILIRFEKEGKVVRDRVAGKILWTWKDHVPSNLTTREYILAFLEGELEIEVRAPYAFMARGMIREYNIAGIHPEIISAEMIAGIYKIRYRWPDGVREAIVEEERKNEERIKQRREERDA